MKKELIDPLNNRYYYQVSGKKPIRPTVRVVKDLPFYPDIEGELLCVIQWNFNVFNGTGTITVNKKTTVSDVLKAIERDAFIFSDYTVVRSMIFDSTSQLITIKITEIWI